MDFDPQKLEIRIVVDRDTHMFYETVKIQLYYDSELVSEAEESLGELQPRQHGDY